MVAACGGSSKPANAPPKPVPGLCVGFSYGELFEPKAGGPVSAFQAADQLAKQDHAQATAAVEHDRHAEAAGHWLACGKRYQTVPDGDPLRALAQQNAEMCFSNAMYAYASGGVLASEGRAKLEQAGDEDRRVAPRIRALLAKAPRDCAIPPR